MQSITKSVNVGNGQTETQTLIGWVEVTEAYEYKTVEQTACNYYMVRVDPGVYEVWQSRQWTTVKIEGEIVDEYFVNRFFSASSVAEKRSIGQRKNVSRQMNHWDAAKEFATNPAWELAVDWKVEMKTRHFDHDNRAYKSFGFVEPIF